MRWEVSSEVLDPQGGVDPDLSEYRVEDAVTSALKNLWRGKAIAVGADR